jgi:uncharacterized phiE125 gp8 family phage protein
LGKKVKQMALKLITEVVTEPVSLAEAKEYLKTDSTSFVDNIETITSIDGGYHATAIYTGTSTSVSGYDAVVLLVSFSNSAGGTADLKIYESNDDVTFAEWTAGETFSQVTTANDSANYEVAYTGEKQYIRAYATVAGAECNFAAVIVKGMPESEEDDYIESLITVARQYCENIQHRALATQTWQFIIDKFPSDDYIELPKAPLQSVTSVKYIDTDGTTAIFTAGSSGYYVDADSEPGKVCLSYGQVWPTTTLRPHAGVIIEFVAGYTGTVPYVLPKTTKQAMLMLISHMYENRMPVLQNASHELEFAVTALLTPHILFY